MIRTTVEASVFGLFRDSEPLLELANPANLTTARYEPASRNTLGAGIVDLLFERPERSWVIAGIRLEPANLVIRERSPFVWPAHVAQTLVPERLADLERFIVPWLRSIARGRAMAHESVRRYAASARFDRARDAELLGAAPLARVMRRMAPFVYARRFAAGAHVALECDDAALAHAVLADVAGSFALASSPSGSSDAHTFAAAWYGIAPPGGAAQRAPDVVLGDDADVLAAPDNATMPAAPVAIATSVGTAWDGPAIDVPEPVPLDLLFSFDAGDAPAIGRFGVRAPEPPLRAYPVLERPNVAGGSAGRIVLAQSSDARLLRGDDAAEVDTLAACLADEGFSVSVVCDASDPRLTAAQLVHVFGSPADPQTSAFAQAARARGSAYVLDFAPLALSPSAYVEEMLVCALRSASDDAERARYVLAFEERRAAGDVPPEPSAAEFAQFEERCSTLAADAVAILGAAEDLDALRARLSPDAAPNVLERGSFAAPEPAAEPIGHLVPPRPFALVHAPIAARSNALFTAYAAAQAEIPLVVAGPCCDVDYLQAMRRVAPSAIMIADPAPGVVGALYRRAAIWIDAAPRPRSAAGVLRATACGALPVLAAESPLTRMTGPGAPVFALTSFAACAATLAAALADAERDAQVAVLAARLEPRRSLARSFGQTIAAYSRVGARAT